MAPSRAYLKTEPSVHSCVVQDSECFSTCTGVDDENGVVWKVCSDAGEDVAAARTLVASLSGQSQASSAAREFAHRSQRHPLCATNGVPAEWDCVAAAIRLAEHHALLRWAVEVAHS